MAGPLSASDGALCQACEKLPQVASVQAVAAFYDLGWHTVKSIDKMRLRARVSEPDWSTIRYLAMDEFALPKGHRYATVVVDPISRQVPWVGPGRSRETAQAFSEQTPEGVAKRIEAVAIDMTTTYNSKSGNSVRRRKSSSTCTTSWPSTAAK